MQIENIFPVPLAFIDVPKEIVDNSLSIAQTYIESKKWRKQRHFGRTITNYFSDKTRNYAGHFDQPLGNYLNSVCREYMFKIGFKPDANLRIETWLNLNLPDTHHPRHEHFGCFMGGVLWLSVPEKSGDFNIFDPVGVRSQNTTQYLFARDNNNTLYNTALYTIIPKAGKMIMFPSWLQHQVEANESNEDRISIAFNIWMTR